jgi:DNA-binding response OmpR family regulator
MVQPPSILSVSSYQSLLQTREWVLKQAGFDVISARNFTEAISHCRNRAFNVVIMCDSLPLQQKQVLIDAARKHRHTHVIALFMRGDRLLAGVDYALEALQGPEKLIEIIRAALKKSSRLPEARSNSITPHGAQAKRHLHSA